MNSTRNLRCLRSILTGFISTVFLIAGCKTNSGTTAAQINTRSTPATSSSPDSPSVSHIKFTSVYTKLDAASCKPIREAENDEDEVPDLCTGFKDHKIFISNHGTVTRITIGREVTSDPNAWDGSQLPSFIANEAGNGQIIEWRLADGEPFACIVRAKYPKNLIDPDEKGEVNELVAINLKGFAPINISIDAKNTSQANDEIRKKTDAAYRKL